MTMRHVELALNMTPSQVLKGSCKRRHHMLRIVRHRTSPFDREILWNSSCQFSRVIPKLARRNYFNHKRIRNISERHERFQIILPCNCSQEILGVMFEVLPVPQIWNILKTPPKIRFHHLRISMHRYVKVNWKEPNRRDISNYAARCWNASGSTGGLQFIVITRNACGNQLPCVSCRSGLCVDVTSSTWITWKEVRDTDITRAAHLYPLTCCDIRSARSVSKSNPLTDPISCTHSPWDWNHTIGTHRDGDHTIPPFPPSCPNDLEWKAPRTGENSIRSLKTVCKTRMEVWVNVLGHMNHFFGVCF